MQSAALGHQLKLRCSCRCRSNSCTAWESHEAGPLESPATFPISHGSAMNVIDLPERDLALREDIRLLGRILGETVRQQQGDAVFATVERIRQISVQFRRDDDEAARAELITT